MDRESSANSYALVTGASRGLGKAIALRLAKDGYNILVNYNSSKEKAEEVIHQIQQLGKQADLIQFDVSNRKETRDRIAHWTQSNPNAQINVLVNNAGIRKDNLMVWMKDEEWDSVIDTSLDGFYNVTKPVLEEMIKRKKGKIVNVVSLSGIKGLPGQSNYSAAKSAVIGATKALSQEVARRKITVNAVAPGFIESDMTEDLSQKEFTSMIPMRRFGTPEEVAGVVSFLISENASYITGEVITVSGGL